MDSFARRSVDDGIPVLHLSQELDSSNSRELGEVLEAMTGETDTLIVDLNDVTHISSTPLGILIAVHSRMRGRRGALAIAAPQRDVRRLFHATGLDDVLHVFDSVDEAADYLTVVERRRKGPSAPSATPPV